MAVPDFKAAMSGETKFQPITDASMDTCRPSLISFIDYRRPNQLPFMATRLPIMFPFTTDHLSRSHCNQNSAASGPPATLRPLVFYGREAVFRSATSVVLPAASPFPSPPAAPAVLFVAVFTSAAIACFGGFPVNYGNSTLDYAWHDTTHKATQNSAHNITPERIHNSNHNIVHNMYSRHHQYFPPVFLPPFRSPSLVQIQSQYTDAHTSAFPRR